VVDIGDSTQQHYAAIVRCSSIFRLISLDKFHLLNLLYSEIRQGFNKESRTLGRPWRVIRRLVN
jgi:hypothetical protein